MSTCTSLLRIEATANYTSIYILSVSLIARSDALTQNPVLVPMAHLDLYPPIVHILCSSSSSTTPNFVFDQTLFGTRMTQASIAAVSLPLPSASVVSFTSVLVRERQEEYEAYWQPHSPA